MFVVEFENSRRETRVIGTSCTETEAFKLIDDFLYEHNFKSYYKRTWKRDDKTTIVDVGSYTEFFHIKEET